MNTLHYVNDISIFLTMVLMFACGAYHKIKMPCLLRFVSLCIGFMAFSFLFSDDELNYTIRGTTYRVGAFIWCIGMVSMTHTLTVKMRRLRAELREVRQNDSDNQEL